MIKQYEKALLDIQGCAFDNCYQEIYGVVRGVFGIDPNEWNEINKRCIFYINTPLCKKHYNFVPADYYVWSKDDKKGTGE